MTGDAQGPIGRDIDDEVGFHIEGRVEELMAEGLSVEEARARALEAFGDVDAVRAELQSIEMAVGRRRARNDWFHGWRSDMRLAARRLARRPGWSLVAVTTLALGLAAPVVTFSVVNGVVLSPLPYPEPNRLVEIWPAKNKTITLSRELGAVPSVASSTGMSLWGMTLTGWGDAVQLRGAVVDAGYFDVFDVEPALGRRFDRGQTEPGRSDVVLLSDRLWRSRFGADTSVVGRRIEMAGYVYGTREVIGVMPPDHRPLDEQVEVWLPLEVGNGVGVAQDSSWYVNQQVARLAPGATVESASAEVRAVVDRLEHDYPALFREEEAHTALVASLLDSMLGDVDRLLWTLLAAIGLVLLIACANLANLLLARGVAERRQLAIRAALGASRWRLLRQQLAESLLIGAGGCALGLLLARFTLSALRVSSTEALPRSAEIGIDGAVLGFAVAACTGAVLLFGLMPALRATRRSPGADAMSGPRGGSTLRSAHRMNRVLLGAEVALAMVLTTAAGLMLSSFLRLRSVDPGLDASDVLAVEVAPAPVQDDPDRIDRLYTQVIERVSALPGVTAAGVIHLLPFTDNNWSFPYLAEGHVVPPNEPLPSANFRVVTPGYFDAVDIPVLAGRGIEPADRAGGLRVMLINRRFADLLWPGEEAVGREIRIFGSQAARVVGVVGDVRQHALDREPEPEMYVPFAQWGRVAAAVLMVEGDGVSRHATAIRDIIRSIDPRAPVPEIRPLEELLGESIARRRFFAAVLVAAGLVALLLGAAGVYGVMSHLIGARMRDFGVRIALGARSVDVRRDALGSGLIPTVLGLAAGTIGALAGAGLLRGMLYGVPPVHAPTYAAVALLLLVVACLAAWAPARRAARMDPLSVLRAE